MTHLKQSILRGEKWFKINEKTPFEYSGSQVEDVAAYEFSLVPTETPKAEEGAATMANSPEPAEKPKAKEKKVK